MNSIKRLGLLFLAFLLFILACDLVGNVVQEPPSVGTRTPAGISLGEQGTPTRATTPVAGASPTPSPSATPTTGAQGAATPTDGTSVSVTSAQTITGTRKMTSGSVDLNVTRLELTQGMSNEPLLIGKATVARVTVGGVPQGSNVDAQVILDVNGKTYSHNVTLVGPESAVNIKIDDPSVIQVVNARVTVNPASPVSESSASNNSQSAVYQTVQAAEKVSVFFMPVDWSPDEMKSFDLQNTFRKFVQDNADFFAGAYPLAKDGLAVDYTLTPHMLSTFEKTLADSQGKFSYRNALALYGSLSIAGRRYRPDAAIVVGVMPPKWFKNHGRPGILGLTLREVKGTVTGEFDPTDPTTAAHEVAHLYYLYEDYDYAVEPPRPGVEITTAQFWVQRYREMTTSSTTKLWTFLSAGSSKVIYWTDSRIYDFLLARFTLNGGKASAPLILAATMTWELQEAGNPADYSAGILRFAPKQPIYISVAGISLNAGSQIEARLFRGDSQINTFTAIAVAGNKWYPFVISKDGSLTQGQYRVDVYLDGELVKQARFEVKASK